MTNIIALSNVIDKYKVIMNTEKEKAIIVYFLSKMVKFHQLYNQLQELDPADETSYMLCKDCKIIEALENSKISKFKNLL